nr:zinc finger, CCHC-type, retrotransposon Gag domain protein [Tanacetum cinerariifolium]
AKNFQWGLRRSTLNHLMCMSYTDVAQVSNTDRNYEILHERDDEDTERPDKRQRVVIGISRPLSRVVTGATIIITTVMDLTGEDQRNRGHQSNRSANSGSQQSRGPSEGYSYPVCTTCGRRHQGECRRAAGTCFKCGQAGHLQKDCKKNTTTSTSGQADKKPGSELTKEDQESQLYDDFEHFRQHKGESIHDYYVRFAKLINDMRKIKMTISKLQLNSKFVKNMLPEWGRFVTAVKLNRGLRDSNYDQLYAYLKQHETHAKENKMMLERFTQPTVDPLALNQATVQDGRVVVQNVQGHPNRGQGMNPQGRNAVGYGGAPNRVGNNNQGQAKPSQARTV